MERIEFMAIVYLLAMALIVFVIEPMIVIFFLALTGVFVSFWIVVRFIFRLKGFD